MVQGLWLVVYGVWCIYGLWFGIQGAGFQEDTVEEEGGVDQVELEDLFPVLQHITGLTLLRQL
jgi:hypothetical protein